jgi:hypothetical protein
LSSVAQTYKTIIKTYHPKNDDNYNNNENYKGHIYLFKIKINEKAAR